MILSIALMKRWVGFSSGAAWPLVTGSTLKLGLKYYDGRVPTISHAVRWLINVLKT